MVHGNNERHVIIVHMISVDAQTNRHKKHKTILRATVLCTSHVRTQLVTKVTEMVDSVPNQASIAKSSHNHVLAVILWLTPTSPCPTLSASTEPVSQRHDVGYAKSANLSKFLS